MVPEGEEARRQGGVFRASRNETSKNSALKGVFLQDGLQIRTPDSEDRHWTAGFVRCSQLFLQFAVCRNVAHLFAALAVARVCDVTYVSA